MKIETIFLDMDGVCVDFVSSSVRLFGRDPEQMYRDWPLLEWSVSKLLGVSESEWWARMDSHGSQFWADMSPYDWFPELWTLCNDTAPTVIATSPSMSPDSLSGKLQWLNKHCGANFRSYLMGPAKFHMSRPGVVLIDDNDGNIAKFEAAGGTAITFPQRWNKMHSQIDDRIGYVVRELQMITGKELAHA